MISLQSVVRAGLDSGALKRIEMRLACASVSVSADPSAG
jgi:hypothetical protein